MSFEQDERGTMEESYDYLEILYEELDPDY